VLPLGLTKVCEWGLIKYGRRGGKNSKFKLYNEPSILDESHGSYMAINSLGSWGITRSSFFLPAATGNRAFRVVYTTMRSSKVMARYRSH